MDNYKVTALSGAHVRALPDNSDKIEILYTIGYNLNIEIDKSMTVGGYVWRHSPKHKGWIRSDLIDQYAHSAEPTPPATIPPGWAKAASDDLRRLQILREQESALIEHVIKLLEGTE
jgi:hypothetical protein